MKPVNIALIGVGRFGKNHLRILKELEREELCKLVKVVDVDRSILYKAREMYPDVAVDTSIESLDESIDIVDIVTPASTHYELAKHFLMNGVHVFIEKPFTLRYRDAEDLVSIARRKGLYIGVGHIFRYNEALREVKNLVKDDVLGKLIYLYGRFLDFRSPRPDVGVVFNFSVHFLDIFDFLLDRVPRKLVSVVSYLLGRGEFEDYAFTTLHYRGVTGYIESSWLYPSKVRELIVVGEDGLVNVDLLFQKYYLSKVSIMKSNNKISISRKDSIEHNVVFEEPLKLELRDFVESVVNDEQSISNGDVGKRIVYLAEKALESGRVSSEVYLDYEER